MSAFGKYGVGGSVPGKYVPGPNEGPHDFETAATGTEKNTPDSKPEVGAVEGSHK